MAGDKHDHHGKRPIKGGRAVTPHHGHSRRPSDSRGRRRKVSREEPPPPPPPVVKQEEKQEEVRQEEIPPEPERPPSADKDEAVMENSEERIILARNEDEDQANENDGRTSGASMTGDDDAGRLTPYHRKYNENFDIKSFNNNIGDFVDMFSDPRYQEVDAEYPVDDLISVVSMVSASIEEFKSYTTDSQRQLEDLREKMRTVKENIHMSVTRQAFEIKSDEELQTVEEKELAQKLSSLNAAVAKANAEVADAVRLSAETESTAVKAQISADRAREEAKRIHEEIELRGKIDAEKRAEEQRRMEEERRRREEEERQEEEERRQKEIEWKRREASHLEKNPWERWPVAEYERCESPGESSVVCIIRGHPAKFDRKDVTYDIIELQDVDITYNTHEELISHVIKLRPTTGDDVTISEPLFVAIPHVLTRAAAVSREVVVKAEVDGQWTELPTKEVTFDNHKDLKFAQAEVRTLTTLLVMSRFKRDYVTLSKRPAKVMSSFDHRVTMVIPKDTFRNKEHFQMQVQPVDSASVSDFRSRDMRSKGLLTSSPVVYLIWESADLKHPITVTLPCPPNPAKAKKLAQIRKMKEEKMRKPMKVVPLTMEEVEKEKEKERMKQAAMVENDEKRTQNKWYMGEYGATDDDENDLLFLLSFSHGRWAVQTEIAIIQAKLDLLTFDIQKPYERFMVIRTRTNVGEDTAVSIATGMNDYLAKRYVQVILKQRSDDHFESCLHIVPVNRVERSVDRLTDEGFEDGPSPSQILTISEGDVIDISFRGNIKSVENRPLEICYNSNVSSFTNFRLTEVDKYLQKNFPVYRGVVQVFRRYTVFPTDSRTITRKDEEVCPLPEVKRDLLCELLINIPKYHVEASPVPVKAPITIHNTRDPVNEAYMHRLAGELGEEWRRVAHYLNVHRVRIQAILRNMQIGEKTDEDAKFDMLMTWLKRSPKSCDKVAILSNALTKSGRGDLSDQVRMRQREFREQQIESR